MQDIRSYSRYLMPDDTAMSDFWVCIQNVVNGERFPREYNNHFNFQA